MAIPDLDLDTFTRDVRQHDTREPHVRDDLFSCNMSLIARQYVD